LAGRRGIGHVLRRLMATLTDATRLGPLRLRLCYGLCPRSRQNASPAKLILLQRVATAVFRSAVVEQIGDTRVLRRLRTLANATLTWVSMNVSRTCRSHAPTRWRNAERPPPEFVGDTALTYGGCLSANSRAACSISYDAR